LAASTLAVAEKFEVAAAHQVQPGAAQYSLPVDTWRLQVVL
jgi:hypothetical protein